MPMLLTLVMVNFNKFHADILYIMFTYIITINMHPRNWDLSEHF